MAMQYPTPKSNSSSRKGKKAVISKKSLNEIQQHSKLLQKMFSGKRYGIKKVRKNKVRKRKIVQTRPYNVSASRDITSKTYKKQRVSRKQQRILNSIYKWRISIFKSSINNSVLFSTNPLF